MGPPLSRKTRKVQFAAGGRQIAQTCPLIDAHCSVTPIRKTWEVHFAASGRQIAPICPFIGFKFELKLEFPPPQVHLDERKVLLYQIYAIFWFKSQSLNTRSSPHQEIVHTIGKCMVSKSSYMGDNRLPPMQGRKC